MASSFSLATLSVMTRKSEQHVTLKLANAFSHSFVKLWTPTLVICTSVRILAILENGISAHCVILILILSNTVSLSLRALMRILDSQDTLHQVACLTANWI